MEFLPWKTFGRIVARYGGDDRVRTLNCGEQYRVMAFAQLTYRESLRDIETCLSVQASKLYHMGLREPHQIEHECPSGLLRADGSHDRHHLRPVHCPGWPLHQRELPRAVAARPLQGCRIWQDTGVSEQSFRSSSPDHCRPLQKPMASGVVLQVDQAAPADQAVLRHVGKCGEDADLDRGLRLQQCELV